MTVKELFGACQRQIARGNGNKEICVAKDEEGNEFVPLYYEFNDTLDDIKTYKILGMIHLDEEPENIILLG